MTDDDARRMRDMLIYARRARSHLGDLTAAGLLDDALRQDGLERAIELVGEAASKVSQPTRARITEVPWRQIVATRHIVAHDYGAIDHAILVEIVREHLPPLIEILERLLASSELQEEPPAP